MRSKDIGNIGEQLATDFLIKKGYTIQERGWRTGHLEVDIIALHKATLHIVEVKTRNHTNAQYKDFSGEAAMTTQKADRLLRATERYVTERCFEGEISLDLIAIDDSAEHPVIRHYTNLQNSF